MKTLTLYLCTALCAPTEDRDRSVPCLDETACTCGAARRNTLIVQARKAANDLSYYNACDSSAQRAREHDAAMKARQRFDEARELCSELGVDWAQGESFLV